MRLPAALIVLAACAAGCTFDPPGPAPADGGLDATVEVDASRDGGATDGPVAEAGVDAGFADAALDAGGAAPDGSVLDSGADGGVLDAAPDASFQDAGPDAGAPDAGFADAATDAGFADAATDAGFADAASDGGVVAVEAGVPDAGFVDAGLPDAGFAPDAQVDAGPPDAGAPPAVALAWSGVPSTLVAGACVPVAVGRSDAAGNPTAEATLRTVTLAAPGVTGPVFFSDAACTSRTSGLLLAAGAAAATVHVRRDVAGPLTLDATAPNLTGASASLTVEAAAPAALRLPPGGPLGWQLCSGAQDVEVVDAFGNRSAPSPAVTVDLTVSPAGAAGVFTDSACSSATPQLQIGGFVSGAPVFLEPALDGTFTLTASALGLTSATATYTSAACLAACNGCGAGTCCRQSCGTGSCGLNCASNCACQFDCQGTQGTCASVCNADTTCAVDCSGVDECAVSCNARSECVVDCRNANECSDIECSAMASCLVYCAGANDCAFDACPGGGVASCPGDIIVCGRPCP